MFAGKCLSSSFRYPIPVGELGLHSLLYDEICIGFDGVELRMV